MLENTLDLCIATYEIHQVSVAFKVKFYKDNGKIEAFQKSNSVWLSTDQQNSMFMK